MPCLDSCDVEDGDAAGVFSGERGVPMSEGFTAMRLAITGAAGFIGSHLAQAALSLGAEVVGIDCVEQPSYVVDGLRLVRADIRDADAMARTLRGATHLAHLAAAPGARGHGPHYRSVNLDGTETVIGAAVTAGVARIVAASSSSIYRPSLRPLTEESALGPRSDYARSKLAAERIATKLTAGRTELALLRYFTVYGPRQRPDMLCSRLLDSARTGTTVTVHGDGSHTRPFTYVGDAASATMAALSTPLVAGPYNIAGSRSLSVHEVAEIVAATVGEAPRLLFGQAHPADAVRVEADTSRAAREFGFGAAVDFATGIRRQLEATGTLSELRHTRPCRG